MLRGLVEVVRSRLRQAARTRWREGRKGVSEVYREQAWSRQGHTGRCANRPFGGLVPSANGRCAFVLDGVAVAVVVVGRWWPGTNRIERDFQQHIVSWPLRSVDLCESPNPTQCQDIILIGDFRSIDPDLSGSFRRLPRLENPASLLRSSMFAPEPDIPTLLTWLSCVTIVISSPPGTAFPGKQVFFP